MLEIRSKYALHIEPASVDLRLADEWLWPMPNATILPEDIPMVDLAKPIEHHATKSRDIILPPRGFVLGRTMEHIRLDKSIVGWIEGRSSFGRSGVQVENAGFVDPGFEGTITLELFNSQSFPVKLYAGTRCCQLVLAHADGVSKGYHGSYQGQEGPRGSEIWRSVQEAIDLG